MLDRLIRGLGVDPIQWRALVMVYLRMDFRATGGATKQQATGRARGHPLFGIALVTGMGGALFAVLAVRIPDVLVSATLLTTYGAINTVMVLLVDFTGLVVSPDDYAVLGHRPVSSRTYFAARLTAILAYITTVSVLLAVLPSFSYALWWHLGVTGLVATFVAVILCDVCASVLIITTYVVMLELVHPRRLRRAFSYLQLVSMLGFYGAS
jgi:hypothetical protein